MKIANFKAKVLYYSVITLFLLSLASIVVSCGPFKPKYTDLRKIPGDPKLKREKNIREGRGFRAMSMFEKGKGSGDFQFASSNTMWRATLDLLDFTPLSNVDYSGGVIITDWFSESSDQDPIKITVRFLSTEVRADGLKVIIYKKICKKNDKNNCKTIKDSTTLGQEIKLAILKKAAIIKSSGISEVHKNYTETGKWDQILIINLVKA